MDHYERTGRNASFTARHFGIARKTLWVWRKRYDPKDLTTLEERSRRPRQTRRRQWPWQLVEAVRELRERYPRWGKDKLAPLLRRQGWEVSVSKVGRILSDLQRRQLFRMPVRLSRRFVRRAQRRPHAIRKPKDYQVKAPGDLLQLDTQEQRPQQGVTLRHYAARDTVSRWDILAVHSRATAVTARSFLFEILERAPFAVRALQIDGGSEFKAEFEEACRDLKLPLFVLPPRSPKLNGRVERSHRTHEEEFYQCFDGELTVENLRPALLAWERTYNHIRPHQALGYLTPAEYVARWQAETSLNENETEPRLRTVPSPV
jgi:transposase InsO family protein